MRPCPGEKALFDQSGHVTSHTIHGTNRKLASNKHDEAAMTKARSSTEGIFRNMAYISPAIAGVMTIATGSVSCSKFNLQWQRVPPQRSTVQFGVLPASPGILISPSLHRTRFAH